MNLITGDQHGEPGGSARFHPALVPSSCTRLTFKQVLKCDARIVNKYAAAASDICPRMYRSQRNMLLVAAVDGCPPPLPEVTFTVFGDRL